MDNTSIKTEPRLKYGLTAFDLDCLQSTFCKFPDLEKAILFGSRAKGNFRQGSDLDIALVGEHLSVDAQRRIAFILNEELPLPYHFDLINYHKIVNENLLDHIARVGIRIY